MPLICWLRVFPWDEPDQQRTGCKYSFQRLKTASLALADMHELQYIQQDWLNLLLALERKVAVCRAHETAIQECCETFFSSQSLVEAEVPFSADRLMALITSTDSCYCHDDACKLPHLPMSASPLAPGDLANHSPSNLVSIALGMLASLRKVCQRWEDQLVLMKTTTVQQRYLLRPNAPSLTSLQLELDRCLMPARL